jgi:hypothetical protein
MLVGGLCMRFCRLSCRLRMDVVIELMSGIWVLLVLFGMVVVLVPR